MVPFHTSNYVGKIAAVFSDILLSLHTFDEKTEKGTLAASQFYTVVASVSIAFWTIWAS